MVRVLILTESIRSPFNALSVLTDMFRTFDGH